MFYKIDTIDAFYKLDPIYAIYSFYTIDTLAVLVYRMIYVLVYRMIYAGMVCSGSQTMHPTFYAFYKSDAIDVSIL